MLNEFKKFIMKGNVLDLAVAVVIGAAFGAIVTSLVDDLIMPPIGLLLSGVDFSELYINLSAQKYGSLAEAEAAGAPVVRYGNFIQAVTNFLIIAFVIFLVVRFVNRLQGAKADEVAGEPTKEEVLLTEIRDLLRAQQR